MIFRFQRFLYTILMLIALPIFIVRLFWKSINFRPYRQRILERLAIYKNFTVKPGGFLIHAVSLGEVVLALPLIKALQANYPDLAITVTTTTPAGSQRVQEALAGKVAHVYMPFDLPWTIARFFHKVQPSCVIIMETEIWPHLINICAQRNVPVLIVNGRISDQSIGRYELIRFFIANVLKQVTVVATQSQRDSERFVRLGLPESKLQLTGNLKFDAQVNTTQIALGKELKAACGDRLIWVAASTHPGEEEQVLAAFRQVKRSIPNCLLILIPRHPDRFQSVAELLNAQKFNFIRRSVSQECQSNVDILLGDTMGEMTMYYAMADVAYVGGSLVPIGGHNLLEPSAVGVPSITGPHYMNFREIVALLQAADALTIVQNSDQLAQQIITLLQTDDLRARKGALALEVCMQNRGALEKTLQLIKSC